MHYFASKNFVKFVFSVYALTVFKVSQKLLIVLFNYNLFLNAALKLFTHSENAY